MRHYEDWKWWRWIDCSRFGHERPPVRLGFGRSRVFKCVLATLRLVPPVGTHFCLLFLQRESWPEDQLPIDSKSLALPLRVTRIVRRVNVFNLKRTHPVNLDDGFAR